MADQREPGVRLVVSLYREFEQIARQGDLSLGQYRTMLYLMGGARRAGELAAANAVTKPTVSAMISGLRDQGWVAEEVDPSDGRVTKVVLTTAGRTRLRRFEADLADRLQDLVPDVKPAELWPTLAALYRSHATTREARLANAFGPPPSGTA